MKRFTLQNESSSPCVMALGYFDGVHLGHRAVIEKAVSEAKARGILSAVFTFTEQGNCKRKKAEAGEIYTPAHRCELFEEMGVDFVVMPDFSDFCSLSPQKFVEILCSRFGATAFSCGNDFRFGKNAAGTAQQLSCLAKEQGFETYVLDEVCIDNVRVSSTRIRKLLLQGDIKKANFLLGTPYNISADVVGGKHLGRARLYPTINQSFSSTSVIPKFGVYASRVCMEDKIMPAVTNIGVCPTFEGQTEPTAETHIIDTEVDLYGKKVKVELLEYLRPEQKFQSVEALKEQISVDIESAISINKV